MSVGGGVRVDPREGHSGEEMTLSREGLSFSHSCVGSLPELQGRDTPPEVIAGKVVGGRGRRWDPRWRGEVVPREEGE